LDRTKHLVLRSVNLLKLEYRLATACSSACTLYARSPLSFLGGHVLPECSHLPGAWLCALSSSLVSWTKQAGHRTCGLKIRLAKEMYERSENAPRRDAGIGPSPPFNCTIRHSHHSESSRSCSYIDSVSPSTVINSSGLKSAWLLPEIRGKYMMAAAPFRLDRGCRRRAKRVFNAIGLDVLSREYMSPLAHDDHCGHCALR
jgi:hypothetical protein